MSEELVRLEGITKSYGSVIAIDSINLTVNKGEYLVLLGPSGSGKTTILSTMGGFIVPTSGKVYIAGEDVTTKAAAFRPTVTVFQDYALFPHMTVLENVSFGLAMKKVPKQERIKRAQESLETVGLKGFGSRKIHQLSGGQRQRVALARAISVEPAVLLLDEPLGALDLKIRHQMQEELVQLQKNLHATFVHVTHDQNEAMSIADNIALINEGRIEDYGPPERVYLRPGTLFAARFMGESNIIEASVLSSTDGQITVDSQFGRLQFLGQYEHGTELHIVFRPEQIKLTAEEFPDRAIFLGEAKVAEIVFQGTHKLCRVHCNQESNKEMLLRLPPNHGVQKDDMLSMHADRMDAVLLTD